MDRSQSESCCVGSHCGTAMVIVLSSCVCVTRAPRPKPSRNKKWELGHRRACNRDMITRLTIHESRTGIVCVSRASYRHISFPKTTRKTGAEANRHKTYPRRPSRLLLSSIYIPIHIQKRIERMPPTTLSVPSIFLQYHHHHHHHQLLCLMRDVAVWWPALQTAAVSH